MNAAEPPPAAPDPIVLRGLSVGYDDVRVVRDVDSPCTPVRSSPCSGPTGSWQVNPGEGNPRTGPGSGGRDRAFGHPVSHGGRHGGGQRHRIGYVPQLLTVGGGIPSTVQEVVSSGRLARRPWYARAGAADRTAISEAIEAVGLGDRRRSTIGHLSGGQQRRGLIARALASEPEVLIMDEPTAGVDAENQLALSRTLVELVARGLTLLVVTHETAPLGSVLTRVVTMSGGRVVSDKPAHGLVTGHSTSEVLG